MKNCEVVPRVALREVGRFSMYYVYILESERDKSHYIGVTADLKKRIKEHNWGLSKYSRSKRPFKLIWCCVFPNKQKAFDFERYLKSSSGFAFANKHFK